MLVQGLRVARKGADYIGTMEVQEKHRFDEQRLARFMSEKVAGFTPPIRVEQFKGGQSNPTYRLTDGAGRSRGPRGPWTSGSLGCRPTCLPMMRRCWCMATTGSTT